MSHQPSMKDSTRYNNTLVDEYYRGFKEGAEHAKQRILIEMLPFLNDTQQRRLRNILENIDETPD